MGCGFPHALCFCLKSERISPFLKCLLKDQPYVEFAYMTGVLPITKYSSGSELNMFVEYDMAASEKFSEYFGFSDTEVDNLYEIYKKNTEFPKFTRDRKSTRLNSSHWS